MLKKLRRQLDLAYRYYINPCYYNGPVRQADFPQHFIEVDMEAYVEEIKSFESFQVDILTTIPYSGHDLPILQADFGGIADKKKHRMLILAGVHGNETGATLAIPKIMAEMEQNHNYYKDWAINIVTPVNPVGTMMQSRYNENGCDLNRKMKSSQEKGIIIQSQVIDELKPNLILTLHEAPSKGFLIHPDPFSSDHFHNEILSAIEKEGIELATTDYFGKKMKVKGNAIISPFMRFLGSLIGVESLEQLVESRKISVITTESGWNSTDLFQRIDSHVLLFKAVIKYFENK
ncbi:MAG: DUF2817 domain-containing protein [Bacteroidota bacterium]